MGDIPGAYVNSCNVFHGDNAFGEWADDVWYEGIDSGVASPLAFMPAISGSSDVEVTLTVSFPEYTGPVYTECFLTWSCV
jgi:hypothetical protein